MVSIHIAGSDPPPMEPRRHFYQELRAWESRLSGLQGRIEELRRTLSPSRAAARVDEFLLAYA